MKTMLKEKIEKIIRNYSRWKDGATDRHALNVLDVVDKLESLFNEERERIIEVIKKDRPMFIKKNISSLMSVPQVQRIRKALRIDILEELGVDCTKMRR